MRHYTWGRGTARVLAVVTAAGVGLALGACASDGSGRGPGDGASARASDGPDLQTVSAWMEGSFSSREQSLADPEYFDIRLHMSRIWTGRSDGPWLYVEQARADLPDRPYRQRVYRLSRVGEGEFRSDVYTLPDPVARYVGAWSGDPVAAAAVAALGPEDLRMLEGCGVVLRWDALAGVLVGGTEGTGCASTREGASYTTSQITLRPGELLSWDRGFDSAGRQVWGATRGGYRFVRERP